MEDMVLEVMDMALEITDMVLEDTVDTEDIILDGEKKTL